MSNLIYFAIRKTKKKNQQFSFFFKNLTIVKMGLNEKKSLIYGKGTVNNIVYRKWFAKICTGNF